MNAAVTRRWRKTGKADMAQAGEFLREREYYCVSACARFLHRNSAQDHVWRLLDPSGGCSAILLHFGRILFPVFGKSRDIPQPRFMKRFLGKVPVHAVQGLREETEILEALLADLGCRPAEHRDYDLMALDAPPGGRILKAEPPGLTLRKPEMTDLEGILPLQAAYEQEEVLPQGAVFNAAVCRVSLQRILSTEQSLIACVGNRVVGKINTNAASFSRTQIGGVYVLPEYRGQGIAQRLTAVFAEDLIGRTRGITLFVKKKNPAAQAVYRHAGFTAVADYRISYY